MSLGIVIKAPEGIVLAAESRLTLGARNTDTGDTVQVNFDNATKLLAFRAGDRLRPVGAVTYGQAAIGTRNAASFLPEFEKHIGDEDLGTEAFAHKLSDFYLGQWKAVMPKQYAGPQMTFVVGGYDADAAYGRVYRSEIPGKAEPVEMNQGDGSFGITWGGQTEFMDRLIRGYDRRLPEIVAKSLGLNAAKRKQVEQELAIVALQLPLQAMPLQDCVDLAVFFIRTTIAGQSLTITTRGVGGPIDVAIVTRSGGLEFIRRKQITVDDS